MIRPSQLLRKFLLDGNVCQSEADKPWRCFTFRLPDGIGALDNAVAIIDKEDVQTGRYMTDGAYRIDGHVRVDVRGVGQDEVYDKTREITDMVDTIADYPVQVGETTYTIISAQRSGTITFHGADATGRRYHYSIEYNLLIA